MASEKVSEAAQLSVSSEEADDERFSFLEVEEEEAVEEEDCRRLDARLGWGDEKEAEDASDRDDGESGDAIDVDEDGVRGGIDSGLRGASTGVEEGASKVGSASPMRRRREGWGVVDCRKVSKKSSPAEVAELLSESSNFTSSASAASRVEGKRAASIVRTNTAELETSSLPLHAIRRRRGESCEKQEEADGGERC